MSFWVRNIETKGRVARAILGAVMAVSGFIIYRSGLPVVAAAFFVAGAFCLFEAARGWCVARACKIRTPL